MTRRPRDTADPQGDADRQKLRRLERETRRAKLEAVGALDPAAKKAAEARVRHLQEQIREHVATSSVFRQRHREQINLGHTPPSTRTIPPRPTPTPPLASPPPLSRRVRSVAPRLPENLTDILDMGLESAATRDAVKDALAQVFDGDYAGLTIELNNIEPYFDFGLGDSHGFLAQMSIFEDTGNILSGMQIGDAICGFYRDDLGDLVAVHVLLELHPEVCGRGFATKFNAHLERWYRQQGVTRIELYANINVGGYTWASHGYDFADEESAANILARLKRHTDDMEETTLDLRARARTAEGAEADALNERATVMEAQIGAARAILERAETSAFGADEYPSAWEISQVGRNVTGEDQWLGKTTMLGSSWLGVKWL